MVLMLEEIQAANANAIPRGLGESEADWNRRVCKIYKIERQKPIMEIRSEIQAQERIRDHGASLG